MTGLIMQYGGYEELHTAALILLFSTSVAGIALAATLSFRMTFCAWIVAMITLCTLAGCASQPPPAPTPEPVATPTPKPVIPPDPFSGLSPDITEAIKHNQTPTLHHGITLVQPYSPDLQYPINCSPLHVTQIRLKDDETTNKDDVKVGDAERWGTLVGEHSVLIFPKGTDTSITVPGSQVTIPRDPNMITNVVISTDKGRSYVLNPVKIGKPFTQAVEWYYPDYTRELEAKREQAIKEAGQ